MGFNVGNFVGSLVGIIVGVVLLGALLTIFTSIEVPETLANADAIEAMFGILPILACVGLVMAAIYIFVSRK